MNYVTRRIVWSNLTIPAGATQAISLLGSLRQDLMAGTPVTANCAAHMPAGQENNEMITITDMPTNNTA